MKFSCPAKAGSLLLINLFIYLSTYIYIFFFGGGGGVGGWGGDGVMGGHLLLN